MLAVLLALAAAPAGGAPDFGFFVERIQPIFLRARTGAARCYNCHSLESNKALFHLETLGADGKWSEEQSRRNFQNALSLVAPGEPLKSRLLTHPLATEAGGDRFHSGGKFWLSRKDPEWRTLAAWVRGATVARPRKPSSGGSRGRTGAPPPPPGAAH